MYDWPCAYVLSLCSVRKVGCYGHDRRTYIVWTRPSCVFCRSTIDTAVVYTSVEYVTDTIVVYTPQIPYRHDRRVHDGREC